MRTKQKQMARDRANSIDYFEKLDTPEKNYWFGFLMADGWICKREYKDANRMPYLAMELQKRDGSILAKLKKAIGFGYLYFRRKRKAKFIRENRVIDSAGSIGYRINSQSVFNDLKSHGFLEKKTGKEELNLNKSLYPWSRLLGFFDGDGTISFNNDRIREESG